MSEYKEVFIRVWQEIPLELIQKHTLIAGDPTGDCSNCRDIGLNITTTKKCPGCGIEFKYIATRLTNNPTQARRLRAKRPDLIAIDLSDYKEATARDNARNIMG